MNISCGRENSNEPHWCPVGLAGFVRRWTMILYLRKFMITWESFGGWRKLVDKTKTKYANWLLKLIDSWITVTISVARACFRTTGRQDANWEAFASDAFVDITEHRRKRIVRWFSRYVMAAMLVDENKRFLISSFCFSTSNCTLQHRLWRDYV